jgi:hypothetical protein
MIKSNSKRKVLLSVLIIALAFPVVSAQSCEDFFPVEEGTVLTYVNYDKKDKVTGKSEISFTKRTGSGDGMEITLDNRVLDDKDELLYEGSYDLKCRGGVLVFEADMLLDPASMAAYQEMEVVVSGDNYQIPLNATEGTVLEDAGVIAEVSSGGMKIMTLTVDMTNRKVTGRETLETPAGSFECTRYSYDAMSKIGFVKVQFSGVEWYSKEYGTVRSETYDKKGKLSAYTLLESVR